MNIFNKKKNAEIVSIAGWVKRPIGTDVKETIEILAQTYGVEELVVNRKFGSQHEVVNYWARGLDHCMKNFEASLVKIGYRG